MKTLTEIFNEHQTDKGTVIGECHNYGETYEISMAPVRNDPIKILEIGIIEPAHPGASLKSWEEYFPNATVVGFDRMDATSLNSDRIKTFIGDQAERKCLQELIDKYGGDYDFIVDDGCHQNAHQQISFGFLFKHLKAGGMYFIEDLHVAPETVALLSNGTLYSSGGPYILPEEFAYIKENVAGFGVRENDKKLGCISKKGMLNEESL